MLIIPQAFYPQVHFDFFSLQFTSPLKLVIILCLQDETPRKQNNSRPWLPDEELALSRELQKDRLYNTYGTSLPSARADPYWEKLMGKLSFMDKYEKEQRIERLCEKVRRMRLRYESLNTRLKAGETSVYKNPHEGTLWRIWHTIWGPNKVSHVAVSEITLVLSFD